jgi:pimeloyl-ACP methyl ester carboxylesterase
MEREAARMNQPPATDASGTGPPTPALVERAVMACGQRIATAMNDAPRELLARAPLVVLPATGYVWHDYLPVLEHFAAERRVFALDWPGFGGSAKPDPNDFTVDAVSFARVLGEWLDALGIGRAVVLGNGIGGTVAVRYAAEHEHRVLGLALVAPRGFGARGPVHQLILGAMSSPVLFGLTDTMLAWLALGPITPAAQRVRNRRRVLRRSPEYAAYETACICLARNEERSLAGLRALARRVTAPTLIMRGALDPIFTAGDARRAMESFGRRKALEVVLPGASHLPFLQAPDRLFQAVSGLLNASEMRALEDMGS